MPLEPDTRREVDSDPCCHRHIVLVWQKQMDILLGFWASMYCDFSEESSVDLSRRALLEGGRRWGHICGETFKLGIGNENWKIVLRYTRDLGNVVSWKILTFSKVEFSFVIFNCERFQRESSRCNSKATVCQWVCLCICPAANKKQPWKINSEGFLLFNTLVSQTY